MRITGFGITNTIYQQRLTPQSFQLPATPPFNLNLGDYHHMAAGWRGTTLWTAYITYAPPATSCFVRKVSLLCSSDLNASISSDSEDITLFENAYLPGDSAADLNNDGAVDVHDELLFWDSYDHLAVVPE